MVANGFIALLLVAVHLALFPLFVWLVSGLCYGHAFAYRQTLEFCLATNFFKALLLYTIPLFFVLRFRQKPQEAPGGSAEPLQRTVSLSALILTDAARQTRSVNLANICYFAAQPPYLAIHEGQKKYLHTGTLSSLLPQLDEAAFVRIHKSVIVNIRWVASYKSRGNGDYDLTLTNGVQLRVSRTYAPAFKAAFGGAHRLAAE